MLGSSVGQFDPSLIMTFSRGVLAQVTDWRSQYDVTAAVFNTGSTGDNDQ